MRTQSLRQVGCWAAISVLLAACGGGAAAEPPAKAGATPATASSAKAAEAPSSPEGGAAPSGETASTETKSDSASTPKEGAKDGPKPTRPPHDVLVQKDTLFMLNFDESDAGKAAEATCSKAGGKDPKALATCMGKERAKIEADGHGFKKDKEGNLTWVVVRRQGKIMVTLHKLHAAFGNETDNTIVVKPEGKDTGKKAGRTPGEFSVDVPSDYRIIISDPHFGKLVYEAKIGLVPDNLL
jgi:hypothetical protein